MNSSRVFDVRTYSAAPGKLEELKARFRIHTLGFFKRHGIKVVGFFEPVDGSETLLYIVEFESSEEADRAWERFGRDPEWAKAKASTETDGPLVVHIDAQRFRATDFSPMS
ncbi:MAG TPA: NIPSNAP family protein [Acidimicrobiales bacterium]|nr:NIPSNAP family protein [Acidimicrobiales bacterium]